MPVSSSLASSGAPAKAPISTGANEIKIAQVFPSGQSVELKWVNSCWQVPDSFWPFSPISGQWTRAA